MRLVILHIGILNMNIKRKRATEEGWIKLEALLHAWIMNEKVICPSKGIHTLKAELSGVSGKILYIRGYLKDSKIVR